MRRSRSRRKHPMSDEKKPPERPNLTLLPPNVKKLERQPGREANAALVQTLEELLALAKKGELVALSTVYLLETKGWASLWQGVMDTQEFLAMVGTLRSLEFEMLHATQNMYEEGPP